MEPVKKEIKFILWGLENTEKLYSEGGQLPKGLLLYGPPGCGKTYLAKALSTETNAHFVNFESNEIYSKWHLDSAKKLKELFDKYKSQDGPTILYIDEIDCIAGPRFSSPGQVCDKEENRLVTILLTEMDGLNAKKDFLIIGSTNMYDLEKKTFGIDSALLRPGRFDKVLYVPSPNKDARKEIFKIHIAKKEEQAGKKLFSDLNLELLAEKTEDRTPAELVHILNEAIQTRIENIILTNLDQPQIDDNNLSRIIDSYIAREKIKNKIGF